MRIRIIPSGMLLQNCLGVLRQRSGRTERFHNEGEFSVHAEALEAFRHMVDALSKVFIFNQRPTEVLRGLKIVEHRLINLP
jgi:hypothetical protein